MTRRVLLADDQAPVRAGLRALLELGGDIVVVGEARHGAEAVELAGHLRPDVVLMDVRMPTMDGITATAAITAAHGNAGPRVLVLTTFDLDEYVFAALAAGASGFLLKNAAPADLRRAVAVVADGQALLDPAVTRRVIKRHTRPANAPSLRGLTTRELEVAKLIAAGLTNDEISRELQVSAWTVKTHVRHILTKLGARDRVQVVIAVYQAGLA